MVTASCATLVRTGREKTSIEKAPKLALVGSSGGHLTQLLVLRRFWERYERFWVTFDTADAVSALADERTIWCHHPTNRHLPNLLRNSILAARVIWRERPTHIVSTGAATAVPFFWIGRLFGAKTIYIEVYDRIEAPTLTGRLVRPVAHHMLVQWPEQAAFYRQSEVVGPLL